MEDNQNIFRFELNESLDFEKGQEIGEMTGISLDPDIAIQPLHDDISIRGVIELRGSYEKETALTSEADESIETLDQSKRFVENVTETEGNELEFTHRFPVEISVPSYRVENVDDVTVGIESFDYELPHSRQLKLTSTIEIRGIYDDSVSSSDRHESENSNLQTLENEDSFSFDVKMDQNTDSADDDYDDLKESSDISSQPEVMADDSNTLFEEQSHAKSSSEEKERSKNKKSQTLAEFFGNDHKESEEQNTVNESDDSLTNEVSEPFRDEEITIEGADDSESEEDIGYLADMFGDGEETYTKMQLRIVQDDDTVESIADRYEISALQLLRQNHLSEEGLEEGQILVIPQKRNE